VNDFRRFVHARRDHPLVRPRRVDGARAFAAARKRWAGQRGAFETGWTRRTDGNVALERAADTVLSSEAPPGTLDVEVLAAAERMLSGGASIVEAVAARFGVAAALAVKTRAAGWSVTSGRTDKVWWWMLTGSAVPERVDLGWDALRIAACAASPEAYAKARDDAAALREAESDVARRVPVDYVFPGEPGWAVDDANALVALPTFARIAYLAAPLLASLDDEDAIVRLLRAHGPPQIVVTLPYACDLAVALAPDAATRVLLLLADLAMTVRQTDHRQLHKLAWAMTSVRGEAMAAGLRKWFRHPQFGRHVVAYFETHADLARVALADVAREKSIAGDAARRLLAGAARAAEPDAGAMEDAPALLRAPPWKVRAPRTEIALEPLPYRETIAWAEGERERLAEAPAVVAGNAEVRPITPAELAEHDKLPEGQKYVDVWPRWENRKWTLLELPDDRRIELWNGGAARLYGRPPTFVLARFGERALDGLFARDAFDQWSNGILEACLRVDSPRAALVCARLLAKRIERRRATAWLLEHAEPAAIALIPAVLGRAGRKRRFAERALRLLAAERASVVADVAARYGDATRAAVEAFAFGDPPGRIDVRGNPPRWLDLAALPALRTRDGRVLPREAAANLVDLLRARGEDVPYAGVDVVRDALDARALADFSWALFVAWDLHGRPAAHGWMAHAVAAFPGDDAAARLAPYARSLAQGDPRACAVIVDVLAALGHDAAWPVLAEIDRLARATPLRTVLAEALGPGSARAPDLGLDARGETRLDLGGREVRVVLDEALAPRVVLADGRRVGQVPRASKTDDPAKVAAATASFNRLRRASAAVARAELAGLERAMVAGRRMRAAELETRWIRHPLLGHAARRIVWGVFLGDACARTFRVAEDGTAADDLDAPLDLDPDASVGVVHPLDLAPEELARWQALFADYEIVQPFEQLGRAVFAGGRRKAVEILKATEGTMVAARPLLRTLDAHGWERATGQRVWTAWRDVRGDKPGLRASVTFAPGVDLARVRTAPDQKIGKIAVSASPALEAVDRVDVSELVRTARALRA
jgi:hypothetical protein